MRGFLNLQSISISMPLGPVYQIQRPYLLSWDAQSTIIIIIMAAAWVPGSCICKCIHPTSLILSLLETRLKWIITHWTSQMPATTHRVLVSSWLSEIALIPKLLVANWHSTYNKIEQNKIKTGGPITHVSYTIRLPNVIERCGWFR